MPVGAISRRKFVKGGAAIGALAAGGSLGATAARAARLLKIGYVSPQTGPLGDNGKYTIIVVDNQTAPEVPLGGKMQALG